MSEYIPAEIPGSHPLMPRYSIDSRCHWLLLYLRILFLPSGLPSFQIEVHCLRQTFVYYIEVDWS